ncbi:uncharacterized protein [Chironomus tepperi]|uniref:uncharacterized protein n=1 Tax=Chironomus tepperi TaxID=113505 RepID=UPI00391EF570
MSNETIIPSADDQKVNKQSQKRKTTSKSAFRNEIKIAKSEIEDPIDLKFETFQLERTSTPNHINICEHCKHSHAKECCMYVYDEQSDIMKYSLFKQSVEEPYFIVDNDDNFHMKIGSTTPKSFPTFTENNSAVADMKMYGYVKHPPLFYVWPIFMPQYPHMINYNPNNFIYYPPANIPNHVPPPAPYLNSCAPFPHDINTNVDYRHYNYNHQQYVGSNNFVPMNYNCIW